MATPVERATAALRAAGIPVIEYPGWRDRRHDGTFTPRAVMLHHDASPIGASPNAVKTIAEGRTGLPGPLAQFWVDYDGRWWVVGNGVCWHAGEGAGWGVIPADQGNRYSIGVETDNTTDEEEPPRMMDSLVAGTAAICHGLGIGPASGVCGHKEYAPGRKPDPDGIDMATFRNQVQNEMDHPTGGTAGLSLEDMTMADIDDLLKRANTLARDGHLDELIKRFWTIHRDLYGGKGIKDDIARIEQNTRGK